MSTANTPPLPEQQIPEEILDILTDVVSSAAGEIDCLYAGRRVRIANKAEVLAWIEVVRTTASTSIVRTIQLLGQLSLEEFAALQKWAAAVERDAKRQASQPPQG